MVRDAQAHASSVPTALGQWAGLLQPQLHGPSQKLWPALGIHHAAQPRAEWLGRASDSYTQGAMGASTPVRIAAACQSPDWRLDPLLQPPAPAPSAEHENAR